MHLSHHPDSMVVLVASELPPRKARRSTPHSSKNLSAARTYPSPKTQVDAHNHALILLQQEQDHALAVRISATTSPPEDGNARSVLYVRCVVQRPMTHSPDFPPRGQPLRPRSCRHTSPHPYRVIRHPSPLPYRVRLSRGHVLSRRISLRRRTSLRRTRN